MIWRRSDPYTGFLFHCYSWAIYHVLQRGTTCQELGADFLERLEPARLTRQ